VIAAAIYGGDRWGPWLWRRVQFLHVQPQCMNYAAPPDVVVYETDPVEGQKLLDGGREYRSHPRTGHVSLGVRCWSLYPYLSEGGWTEPLIFLHRRTDPYGAEKLVSIQMRDDWGCVSFFPSTFTPGTLTATPGVSHASPADPVMLCLGDDPAAAAGLADGVPRRAPDRLRVFAGQADPHDPSHFTIGYELNGVPGTVDGWLRQHHSIELRPRAGYYVAGTPWPRWYPEGSNRPRQEGDRPVQGPHYQTAGDD
jgi:hypothetical protein